MRVSEITEFVISEEWERGFVAFSRGHGTTKLTEGGWHESHVQWPHRLEAGCRSQRFPMFSSSTTSERLWVVNESGIGVLMLVYSSPPSRQSTNQTFRLALLFNVYLIPVRSKCDHDVLRTSRLWLESLWYRWINNNEGVRTKSRRHE